MQEIILRTGVWYNDRTVKLNFPDSWNVLTYWPNTPPPLTPQEIVEKINSPMGQPPLRELAKGKKRPVIITDDLARPTPVFKILPSLLAEFKIAGIQPHDIRILVATGTHGDQDKRALSNKIGKESFDLCKVIVHNDQKNTRYVGKTSFKTPVYVNQEVLKSDLVLGIGGVYPQHTTGFGGGAKLALGILDRKSIRSLHFRHKGVEGTYNIDNPFRKDVTEIARMIRLDTLFTLHINSDLDIVNLMGGNHFLYYPQAADFSKSMYTAPPPSDADVVIANGYPSDISYTFMRKGMKPIRCAPPSATKIAIASNPEGIGRHGLFPQGKNPRLNEYRHLYNKISVMEPKVIAYKIYKNIFLRKKKTKSPLDQPQIPREKRKELWLYRPEGVNTPVPQLPGVHFIDSWDKVLSIIEQEHYSKKEIKVRIYPCSSLQCLDAREGEGGGGD